MRTVIGYIEGRAIWSENVPAYGATFAIRGELAKPAPRPARGAGLTPSQRKPPDDVSPNAAASRRYRAAHPDRTTEYQRQYRARIRAEVAELREERAS